MGSNEVVVPMEASEYYLCRLGNRQIKHGQYIVLRFILGCQSLRINLPLLLDNINDYKRPTDFQDNL